MSEEPEEWWRIMGDMESMVDDLVSVQPMDRDQGEVFEIECVYGHYDGGTIP